ncbi:proline--tRNA ligase [Fructilactobacillus fructivorans]|uniref:Proline--tRNA ligase n=1 Tax=Fructilactobacillus fructivorans TaxID=1614 RepID=A0AAE6P0R4_9LACO|nr:proline--tRNA ligase [Fructilactobacillus fructivorans]KRK58739.1 prolyl-tRNA synthetase [Fructilactobacillus fructivorans]KRN39649.1 prolyl-tRNA synthetase [Fructilactobacillus fructivorans]KRN43370.1 prolyl-tRNA synthetase [Fructilactobacillus fructivorans]QFX92739.1 proline--tRNA ligase [Fructilactobacillus fructivorans]RDV65669.1 proline--tRNA ligase [Fructilactobacillus fructivorans]
MKQSKLLIPTLKQDPAGAEALSHKMLVRAGFVRQVSAGMYAYLPLAYRVLENIKKVVREELAKTDAAEMLMPAVIPAQLWKDSGRYDTYGPELFKFKNRHDTDFILGPTHEETFTDLIKNNIKSYKKLPLILYQIQPKYRDEDRPRYGLLRSREFIMLDAYSFSENNDDLDKVYKQMESAFQKIFDRIGLNYRTIIGDAGSMGGSDSKEFSAPAAVGEDTIVYSDDSDYAANLEMATNMFVDQKGHADLKDLELVDTPDVTNINQVSKFFDIEKNQIIKSLLYIVDDKPVMILIRGDQKINPTKVKNYFNADSVELASPSEVQDSLNVKPGSVGPIKVPDDIPVYADQYVKGISNAVTGANENGKHYKNVNYDRDYQVKDFGDFHLVKEGNISPDGSGVLKFTKGIEIGHIFKLGTRYSKTLGADILDKNGRSIPVVMGSYGIGISRLLSAVSEQQADQNGLVWPKEIAPYDVHIIPTNVKNDEQLEMTTAIEKELESKGLSVLVDDRKERAGVKFADSDLIGIPIRVTIGKKADEGIVEVKIRKTGETIETKQDDLNNTIDILSKEI